MSPGARRIIIPIMIALVAIAIVVVPPLMKPKTGPGTGPGGTGGTGNQTPGAGDAAGEPGEDSPSDAESSPAPDEQDSDSGDSGDGDDTSTSGEPGTQDDSGQPPVTTEDRSDLLDGLHAIAPTGGITVDAMPASLGSFDWREHQFRVDFARNGSGIAKLTFSDFWTSAEARKAADALKERIVAGNATLSEMPDDKRYVLLAELPFKYPDGSSFDVPALAARRINVSEASASIDLSGNIWSEEGPGVFVTEIQNAAGEPILRIRRIFTVEKLSHEIALRQRVENLSGRELTVQWIQSGPGDLPLDNVDYMDRRRFRIGYRPDPAASKTMIRADDNDMLFERQSVIKMVAKNRDPRDSTHRTLWPNEDSVGTPFDMAWFASTNRYFSLAIEPASVDGNLVSYSLTDTFQQISPAGDRPSSDPAEYKPENLLTEFYSQSRTVAAGGSTSFDVGIYAGPLDRNILYGHQPYESLNLGGLILYQMSSMCAFCTFQWLAHFLIWFLTFLEGNLLFDWGLAIIALVVIVRTLLHPITKKAQVNMQRFGKKTQAIKPEMDKLRKKYGSDPKRMQQEQMRLWKEHDINPLHMAGCLPMFLQMPIWFALYATLYFAFEIRQEAAFFGLFQVIGGWPFLADLSAPDHFFGKLDEPFWFLMWNITGFNFLPLLMGVIFFIQQKYMTPPTAATMTKEQQNQQKIMKVMMVVMMPLFLYSAPSGLTLYILTSSCIAIIESRYIRQHVKELDEGPDRKKKVRAKVKKKDPTARAYNAALDRAREKRKGRDHKSYKKRQ